MLTCPTAQGTGQRLVPLDRRRQDPADQFGMIDAHHAGQQDQIARLGR